MTQIRGNQPSFSTPASEKTLAKEIKSLVDHAHGESKKALQHEIHDLLDAAGVKGAARSRLKLDAKRDLKKHFRVLDAAFVHRHAPAPVVPATRAS